MVCVFVHVNYGNKIMKITVVPKRDFSVGIRPFLKDVPVLPPFTREGIAVSHKFLFRIFLFFFISFSVFFRAEIKLLDGLRIYDKP